MKKNLFETIPLGTKIFRWCDTVKIEREIIEKYILESGEKMVLLKDDHTYRRWEGIYRTYKVEEKHNATN